MSASTPQSGSAVDIFVITYNLVDAGHLGLEDGDGVTDGGLLAGSNGGSERSVRHVQDGLLRREGGSKLGQHFVCVSIN